jgi:hypothetical protein
VRHASAPRHLRPAVTPFPLLVAAPAQAAAAPEVEPNDNILQVTATANTEGLTGTIGADGDVDHFWLGLRPQRQVKILATASGCTSTNWGRLVRVEIDSPDNQNDDLVYLRPETDANTVSATTTTPGVYGGPTQYFMVTVSDDGANVGCRYTLQVQSSTGGNTDAIDPSPPATYPVVPLAEPDDLRSQAFGPLLGETSYSGKIETSNDVDQVYFQVRAGAAVNVRLSVGAGEVYVDSDETGGDDDLDSDPSASAGEYAISTVAVASTDRAFRLALSGDAGSTYQLLLSPGTSLGVTPPPPPPPPYFGRSVTIKRTKGAYAGRVASEDSRCVSSVVVTLRKKGHGKAVGKTSTTANGTWRIKHKKKVRKVYATIGKSARDGYTCGSDRSRVLKRGR